MESYKICNLTFSYPESTKTVLSDINLTIAHGEFVTICGHSGCGKTTLLRMLKPALTPYGNREGSIYFENTLLSKLSSRQQAECIGFVLQNPDNQIVTDKVWHELAFGLEGLGYSSAEIRTRVAEMASFFGIQNWFHKKVTDLSGGQKQLLNLASVMVMQPSVLILDEPTSQLDPIAAQEFLKTLEKINRELGTTVILTEHRLEDAFAMSDRVVVMEEGKIIASAPPREVGQLLKSQNHPMYSALPAPMRVFYETNSGGECPLTVREGRTWLENFKETNGFRSDSVKGSESTLSNETCIELKDVWFRYEKNLPDVVKGLSLSAYKGEFFALMGGNGTGKSTALSLMSGLRKPVRGNVYINGKKISDIPNLYSSLLGVLPQNPQTLFVKNTVYLDLAEMLPDKKSNRQENDFKIRNIAKLCMIEDLLSSHPYDLSGGEQQRVALAKVLLLNPSILLMDEPTKGMDAHFKGIFADIIASLKSKGVTIVMVSHDIEFCARYADRCALMFDGNITSCAAPREFFTGNNFYTTSSNRMARTTLPKALLPEDIITSCGYEVTKREPFITDAVYEPPENEEMAEIKPKKINWAKLALGVLFGIAFCITMFFGKGEYTGYQEVIYQLVTMLLLAMTLACFLPKKKINIAAIPRDKRRLSKRTWASLLSVVILVPLTIYIGWFYLGDRKYYFISLLIIFETLLPFCIAFENKKPSARELIVISVLCAIAVASRAAFYMLPQFKPVAAVIIISAVCFGAESGFLVGIVSAFVSNFIFGQGPWTPWQMFAFGIVGFLAGVSFRKGLLLPNRASLAVFGGVATVVIYGGIVNPGSLLAYQPSINLDMIIASYITGFPFDLVHGAATAFFLWFMAEPMIEKIERVKVKYGLAK